MSLSVCWSLSPVCVCVSICLSVSLSVRNYTHLIPNLLSNFSASLILPRWGEPRAIANIHQQFHVTYANTSPLEIPRNAGRWLVDIQQYFHSRGRLALGNRAPHILNVQWDGMISTCCTLNHPNQLQRTPATSTDYTLTPPAPPPQMESEGLADTTSLPSPPPKRWMKEVNTVYITLTVE